MAIVPIGQGQYSPTVLNGVLPWLLNCDHRPPVETFIRRDSVFDATVSDALDAAYTKYLLPHGEPSIQPDEKVVCLYCGSENVDRTSGYRGEYYCLDCAHFWQVGGWQAT